MRALDMPDWQIGMKKLTESFWDIITKFFFFSIFLRWRAGISSQKMLQNQQNGLCSTLVMLPSSKMLSTRTVLELKWVIHMWFWLRFIVVKIRTQRTWRNHIDRTGSWVAYKDGGTERSRELWRWVFSQLCAINFLQPFLENIDRRSCNDGNR